MKDIQKIEIESTESIEYFFFSGVSFTFDYGKGNAQFRKLSLFIFLNSRETTFWLPVH